MLRWLTMASLMSDRTTAELRRVFEEQMQQASPPEWIQEMIAHYRRTGTYRAKDLRRLLGDPKKGVEIGPQISLATHFTQR